MAKKTTRTGSPTKRQPRRTTGKSDAKAHPMIGWFEIPTTDLARAKAFYEHIFAFSLQPMALGNGLRMELFPGTGMSGGGALCHHPNFYHPGPQGALIYFNAGPDLSTVLHRVEAAGGRILVPKTMISPEYGHMAVFQDSEGNRIALHSRN